MASKKALKERLEQIKERASAQAAKDENKAMANLAEEAASLALEVLEGGK
jgi:F0F1-type ATP synthase membrane subunit b/b'